MRCPGQYSKPAQLLDQLADPAYGPKWQLFMQFVQIDGRPPTAFFQLCTDCLQ
jgi:hypothetical protein